jgi:limonene-1,2-epoxide hydrolase
MGAAEEKLVMEFLRHGEGREMDVDAIVAMMTDDVVFQGNVPTRKPRVGRAAAREELARGAAVSTGDLDGEVLSMVSSDRLVFQERNTIFEVGDKRITLRLAAVLKLSTGRSRPDASTSTRSTLRGNLASTRVCWSRNRRDQGCSTGVRASERDRTVRLSHTRCGALDLGPE